MSLRCIALLLAVTTSANAVLLRRQRSRARGEESTIPATLTLRARAHWLVALCGGNYDVESSVTNLLLYKDGHAVMSTDVKCEACSSDACFFGWSVDRTLDGSWKKGEGGLYIVEFNQEAHTGQSSGEDWKRTLSPPAQWSIRVVGSKVQLNGVRHSELTNYASEDFELVFHDDRCETKPNTGVVSVFSHTSNSGQTASSVSSCSRRCSATSRCKAWVFQPSTGKCWLTQQTGAIEWKTQADRTSGLRCEASQTTTMRISIGHSETNRKCAVVGSRVMCAPDAGNKGERFNRDYADANDAFAITVTDGTTVCAQRTDKSHGWGMNLEIACALQE